MALLLALLSSVLWGTSDFLGGVASRRLRSIVVVGWSQSVGLVVAFIVCLVVGAFDVSDLRTAAPWAVAAGLSGAAGLVMFYAALAAGTMGVVAPIAATGVVVPVAAGVLGGERPTVLQGVGLLVAVVGVVLACGPELRGAAGARPFVLAAAAALAFGLSLTFLAEGSSTSTPLTLLLMRVAPVAGFVVLALVLRSRGGVRRGDLPVLTVMGVGDVAANLCFGLASTMGLLAIVSVAGSLYPVVTAVLAVLILRERLARSQVVGVVLALGGVALLAA
jgi:drug/metabolite transporter (DMT)-like permease